MLRKRIVSLLSISLLFTYPTNAQTPLSAEQSIEKQVDNNKMVQIQDYRLKNLQEQVEKQKSENDKKKVEEEAKKQEQLEEQKKNEPQWREFELTFYSSLNCENGYGAITSTGCKLFDGVVASNHYKINTKIKLQGWGEVVVLDRGSNKYFNNDYRLDVYIPRENCESDSHYYSRVNKMGRIRVKGTIIKQ